MNINLTFLRNSLLFSGLKDEDLHKLSKCLNAKEKEIQRDTFVFRTGDPVRSIYYILSGSMLITEEDFWGNRSIIENMYQDTLFGEAYFFSSMETHLVNVVAAQNSRILEINPEMLFETCSKNCECHAQLRKNALSILSRKIVLLTEKVGHIMQRTIREKILSYLSLYAQKEKSNSFDIPYTRQQLADYLCVDRSALSHELSRLQTQGMIKYHKNHFMLLNDNNK